MRSSILSLFLVLSSFGADGERELDRTWVDEPFSSQLARFEKVTLQPCPKDKAVVAANCEAQEQWWGHLRVFKLEGDKIEWAAQFPDEYAQARGHYLVSCRWQSLSMLDNPVLEVIESTHMGNGSLWLFELLGRELRLLLHTPVRGRFWKPGPEFGVPVDGEARYAGEHLRVEFRKASDAPFDSVHLTGAVVIADMSGHELPSKPFEQICTWDKTKRIFIPQPPTSPTPSRPQR